MPLYRCGAGWRWGSAGKCYRGPGARSAALRQGRAIQARRSRLDGLDEGLDDSGFEELQDAQRGKPESMFHPGANPGAEYSSIYQWMMEHTGDLIHRAACGSRCGGGWGWGIGAVREKARKLLRSAENPRDIEDVVDQVRRNRAFYLRSGPRPGEPLAAEPSDGAAIEAARAAGRRYAAAYADLVARFRVRPPGLTVLQAWGGRAAIALGEMDWPSYRLYLYRIAGEIEEAERRDEAEGNDDRRHLRALYFRRRA